MLGGPGRALRACPRDVKLATTSPAAEINRGYARARHRVARPTASASTTPARPVRGVQHRTRARRRDRSGDRRRAPPDLRRQPLARRRRVDPDVVRACASLAGLLRRGRRPGPPAHLDLRRRPRPRPRTSSSTRPTTPPTPCGSTATSASPASPDPLPGQVRHGRPHRLRHRHRALRRRRARPRDRRTRRRVARRGAGRGRVPGQPRRPAGRVDQRPVALDPAPGGAAARRRATRPRLRRSMAFFHDGNYDALVEVPADLLLAGRTRPATSRSWPATTSWPS